MSDFWASRAGQRFGEDVALIRQALQRLAAEQPLDEEVFTSAELANELTLAQENLEAKRQRIVALDRELEAKENEIAKLQRLLQSIGEAIAVADVEAAAERRLQREALDE